MAKDITKAFFGGEVGGRVGGSQNSPDFPIWTRQGMGGGGVLWGVGTGRINTEGEQHMEVPSPRCRTGNAAHTHSYRGLLTFHFWTRYSYLSVTVSTPPRPQPGTEPPWGDDSPAEQAPRKLPPGGSKKKQEPSRGEAHAPSLTQGSNPFRPAPSRKRCWGHGAGNTWRKS